MAWDKTKQPVNWQAIFRKYSWWYDPANERHFVIVSRYYDANKQLEAVDLLEEKKEWPVRITLAQMINYFDKELLKTESVMADCVELEIVI
jgi:hypothetical protein